MPIRYRIFKPHGLLYAEGTDPLTDRDITTHAFQLCNDPEFERGFRELLDLRRINQVDLTSEGVYVTSVEVLRHKELLADSNLAIVAPSDEIFGMARMYEMMLTPHLEGIRVFRTIESALDFLSLKPATFARLKQAFASDAPEVHIATADIVTGVTPANGPAESD